MTQQDYSKKFSCPQCGTVGAIYLLKVTGSQMLIKQNCPTHGARKYVVPLMQKDEFMPYIHDAVFRCFKCGQEAVVDHVKVKGPWSLIRCTCPTHKNKLPVYKIWSSVYNEISSKELETQPPTEPEPAESEPTIGERKEYCPHCGTPLRGVEKFCGACGAELD
ncbi:MAG: zinc-ribbon domain-containing protein [Promethearchaeota archaeon]|jgi:transcription elongation factor Elf1